MVAASSMPREELPDSLFAGHNALDRRDRGDELDVGSTDREVRLDIAVIQGRDRTAPLQGSSATSPSKYLAARERVKFAEARSRTPRLMALGRMR
jgi:hypothetical protein